MVLVGKKRGKTCRWRRGEVGVDCEEEESKEERNAISCGMGNQWVYKSMSVEWCGWVHWGGGSIFGIGLELEQCEHGQLWGRVYWSHCSSIVRYSQRDRQARKNWTIRGYGVAYKLKGLEWSGRDWIQVPKCFHSGVSFPGHQVLLAAFWSFMWEDSFNFIFFFIIYDVRRWFKKGWSIFFDGAIRR